MADDLAGQTVVVIGGSAGIGFETARQAREAGAQVVITGRDPERLRQAAAGLKPARTEAFDAYEPDPAGRRPGGCGQPRGACHGKRSTDGRYV
jgi:NAD(P)-dependent dehydrogenase (short-subunit alcohol dehydrogenase family)